MDSEYTDRLLQTVRPAAAGEPLAPQAVLHAAYEAIIQGDFDTFGESMADDVELHIHGFSVGIEMVDCHGEMRDHALFFSD